MSDRFPLLRLPQDALKRVLRSMEPLDLILFSFYSNRNKSLVASINMRSKVKVMVSNDFTIHAKIGEQRFKFLFYSHEVKNDPLPIKMGTPEIVYLIHFDGKKYEGTMYVVPRFMDIPSWLSHIKTIFNCSNVFQLRFFLGVGNFDLDSLRDSMLQENIHELVVSTSNSDEYNPKIMKTFGNMNHLYLDTDGYENGKPPGKVLIQNFSEFQVGSYNIYETTMTLDDILMLNSKEVHFAFSELTEKDVNRFLKLWMRGNSKLECFSLSFAHEMDVDEDTVLKGIKFQETPGGFDVIRRDGTRGTISFDDDYMEFLVWHD